VDEIAAFAPRVGPAVEAIRARTRPLICSRAVPSRKPRTPQRWRSRCVDNGLNSPWRVLRALIHNTRLRSRRHSAIATDRSPVLRAPERSVRGYAARE
jgi:hypothetical protein